MTTKTQTRAPARALVGAAAFGSLVGLAMGCAYLGGSIAKSSAVRAQAVRLVDAAESGYAEPAVIDAAAGLDESAVSIARRHDPYEIAGGAHRDRQAAQFAARLEHSRRADQIRAGLRKAGMSAAERFDGALDASRDLECLTQAVYYEARGEGQAGMQAVAQVVLNRVRHPAFPKTVCGVVFQGAAQRSGCQFSFACDGSMRRGVGGAVWTRAEKIAAQALAGRVMPEVGKATHFHTTAVSPAWAPSLLRVAQVGSHVFYRFGAKPGATSAFRYSSAKPSTTEFQPVYAGFPGPAADSAVPAEPTYRILFVGLQSDKPTGDKPVAVAPAQPAAAEPATRPTPSLKTEPVPVAD